MQQPPIELSYVEFVSECEVRLGKGRQEAAYPAASGRPPATNKSSLSLSSSPILVAFYGLKSVDSIVFSTYLLPTSLSDVEHSKFFELSRRKC